MSIKKQKKEQDVLKGFTPTQDFQNGTFIPSSNLTVPIMPPLYFFGFSDANNSNETSASSQTQANNINTQKNQK